MIEVTLLSKTKTQANLLPSFAAAESNGGSSFRDIMTSLRDKGAVSSVSNSKNAVNHVSDRKNNVNNVSTDKNVVSVYNSDNRKVAVSNDKNVFVSEKTNVESGADTITNTKLLVENGNVVNDVEKDSNDSSENSVLALLGNAAVYITPVNDENTSMDLSNVENNEGVSEINLLNIKSMEDVEKLLSDLNLNEEDIARIKNILENASKLSKEELNNLGNIIDSLREGINKENFSLSDFVNKLTAGKVDLEDLEINIKELSDKLQSLSSTGKENVEQEEDSVKLLDIEAETETEAVEEKLPVTDKEMINLDNSNFDEVLSSIADLVEDMVSISSKTEVSQDVSNIQLSDKEKMGAVLNLLKEYADSVSTLTGEKTAKAPEVLKNINIPVTENVISKETVSLDNEIFSEETILKDKNGLSLRQESEELLKDLSSGKVSTEKISTDVSKQQNVLTVKDIQKEFKTMNMEVDESLRGQAQLKADEKAVKVNMADGSKTSLNLGDNKNSLVSGTVNEENFSNNSQEKGNNFNYLLKQSNDVQLKESINAQNKEVQQSYNLKDSRDIERLLRNIQSTVSKGESKLTVTLTPENLGRLQIQLTESGGKITAKFLSDNENSHKLIMAQSDLLKNQLSEKGIVVDDMQFSFNDAMSKQQEQGSENSKRAGKHAKGRFMKENEEDVEVGTDIANKNTSGLYA